LTPQHIRGGSTSCHPGICDHRGCVLDSPNCPVHCRVRGRIYDNSAGGSTPRSEPDCALLSPPLLWGLLIQHSEWFQQLFALLRRQRRRGFEYPLDRSRRADDTPRRSAEGERVTLHPLWHL